MAKRKGLSAQESSFQFLTGQLTKLIGAKDAPRARFVSVTKDLEERVKPIAIGMSFDLTPDDLIRRRDHPDYVQAKGSTTYSIHEICLHLPSYAGRIPRHCHVRWEGGHTYSLTRSGQYYTREAIAARGGGNETFPFMWGLRPDVFRDRFKRILFDYLFYKVGPEECVYKAIKTSKDAHLYKPAKEASAKVLPSITACRPITPTNGKQFIRMENPATKRGFVFRRLCKSKRQRGSYEFAERGEMLGTPQASVLSDREALAQRLWNWPGFLPNDFQGLVNLINNGRWEPSLGLPHFGQLSERIPKGWMLDESRVISWDDDEVLIRHRDGEVERASQAELITRLG